MCSQLVQQDKYGGTPQLWLRKSSNKDYQAVQAAEAWQLPTAAATVAAGAVHTAAAAAACGRAGPDSSRAKQSGGRSCGIWTRWRGRFQVCLNPLEKNQLKIELKV